MKSVTLNATGLKFTTSFNTTVIKVTNPDKNSTIVIEAARFVEISLGDTSAKSLGIERDSQVSIKPVSGSTDGSFTLQVLEKQVAKPADPMPSRGSGCSSRTKLSAEL